MLPTILDLLWASIPVAAAMGFLSRQPTSNLPPVGQPNPWIEATEEMDAAALILAGEASRCVKCGRPSRNKYLEMSKCPDCRPKDEA